MPKTIVLVATLDTKGDEVGYLKEQIEARGHETIVWWTSASWTSHRSRPT